MSFHGQIRNILRVCLILGICLLALGRGTSQDQPKEPPVKPPAPEEKKETPPLVVPPENMEEPPVPRSLLERFRDGPAPIPPGGPEPNTYGEPMVLPPLIGDPAKKKYPIVQVGGVFQIDSVFYDQTAANRASVGNEPDGTGIKRARLTMFGSVSENLEYRFQFDLGGFGRPSITDMYIDIKDVPLLDKVRVGQWKQPFSMEEVTSFRFNPFMERSSLFVFSPFRRTGIGFYDWTEDQSWTWMVSAFRGFQDFYGNDLGNVNGYGGVGRLTHCFYYEDEGAKVFHFGGGYSIIAPSLTSTFFFGKFGGNSPELGLIQGQFGTASFRQNQSMVQTPVLNASPMYYQIFHLETAWVHGPLSIQAEGDIVPVANNGNLVPGSRVTGTPTFSGFYVFATYFLTGEHRVYDRNLAVFDRIIPKKNSSKGDFLGGAWEVGVRLNYINLNSNGINGGRLIDPTFALNWYLNPYTKFSFNYIPIYLKQGDIVGGNTKNSTNQWRSQANAFGVQAQVDF